MKKKWILLSVFALVGTLYLLQKPNTTLLTESKITKKEVEVEKKETTPIRILIPKEDDSPFQMSEKEKYEEEHDVGIKTDDHFSVERIKYIKEENLSDEDIIPIEAEMSQEDRVAEEKKDNKEIEYLPKESNPEPIDNDIAVELRLQKEEDIREQEAMIEEDMATE